MKHFFFFMMLAAATIIRFHDISRSMIFIGDQGRDFLVAREMATEGKVPLLGIPSSVPRFKQGPLYIYFLALTYWISNGSVLATGLLAAGFGTASIVALYLFAISYVDRMTALIASTLYAFFPMMILHSRMPYHVNPIPFFIVVYLWQLVRLAQGKKGSAFGAGLSFALVFQFELAAFPLILLIPITYLLRTRFFGARAFHMTARQKIQCFAAASLGVGVGLLPQIIYDLSHGFSQIGGFLVWVVYKIVTALLPFTRNSLADASTPLEFKELLVLFTSIFTQNGVRIDQLFWLGIIIAALLFVLIRWKLEQVSIRMSTASFVLLAIGFVFHRVPSEAYMPLFAIPVSLLIAHLLTHSRIWYRIPLMCILGFSLLFSSVTLYQHNYFLQKIFVHDWQTYRFGPSIATQRLVVDVLFALSDGKCVDISSKERDETFPSLYNHLDYLIAIDARSYTSADCKRFLIDRPQFARDHWDTEQILTHTDLGSYWIVSLDPKEIYAKR